MNDIGFTKTESAIVTSIASIMGLSGFFHDNGKAILGFQNNLASHNNGKKADLNAVRHEVVSAVQLLPLLKGTTKSGECGFSCISTPEKVRNYFEHEIADFYEEFIKQSIHFNQSMVDAKNTEEGRASVRDLLNNTSPYITDLVTDGGWEKAPLVQSLIYLVLTHHKLPNGKIGEVLEGSGPKKVKNEYMLPVMDPYFKQEPHPDIRRFLTITNTPPWHSDAWCRGVASAACKAMEAESLVGKVGIRKSIDWSAALLYLARPSLVLADYHASSIKKPCPVQDPSVITYANTVQDGKRSVWADPLEKHLILVGEKATQLYDHLAIRSHSAYKKAKSLSPSQKPHAIANPDNPGEESPFYWQYAISTTLAKTPVEGGFFGVLMSKTGAGKTKGAPQIMCALSPETRFNIALGMRTLTMQTFKAYTSSLIGFKKSDVALMIGSGSITEQETNDSQGSANHYQNEVLDFEVISDAEDTEHPLTDLMLGEKQRKMLNTPISVMTVDHLIQATSQQSGANAALLPEIMTSDCILDEIDDYNAEDLIAIGKLIFLHGFYGKKVIVSSATSSNIMIEALQQSYLEGYSHYQARYSAPEPVLAYMSHEAPYLHVANPGNSGSVYEEFISSLAKKTSNVVQRHKVCVATIQKDSWPEDAFQECKKMGERYSELDTETGVEVSIGFVRFNNTASSRTLAQYLLDRDEEPGLAVYVQNYHSRMDDATRYFLESELNTILTRNGEKALTKHPRVKVIAQKAKEAGNQRVLIVVSTTNIQETGRDHDYDWAIVEPYTDKSIIQCAGRVWRHRRSKQLDNGPNLAVLSQPIKAFDKPDRCWSFPGIETATRDFNEQVKNVEFLVNRSPASNLVPYMRDIGIEFDQNDCGKDHVDSAIGALASSLFEDGICASPAISKVSKYEHARMGSVEHCKTHHLLVNRGSLTHFGLGGFLSNGSVMLTKTHGKIREFRKQAQNAKDIEIVMKDPLSGFKGINWSVKVDGNQSLLTVKSVGVKDPYKRIFIAIDTEDAVAKLCELHNRKDIDFAERVASGGLTYYGGGLQKKEIQHSAFFGYKDVDKV